ncbi:hypothetical protein MRB53_028078 [Persea americana]|uniref:Uncharacterized protein n=1 Tax=Persea americana TaxID=3435 RepID=A0ACC2KEL3_PERAE|nr:hypothetical protein MRB53_028078 [Persea americana]
MEMVQNLASEHAVVIFSMSSCCMCHTIKTLFGEIGVHPAVYELDQELRGREMQAALTELVRRRPPVPAVFIGSQFRGSNREVMQLHITGALIPLLREAGAIWL